MMWRTHSSQASIIIILGLRLTFEPTRKIFLRKCVTLNFIFIVSSPSVLAIQKTYRKNASDFSLEKQDLQTSLKVSSKNFANNGLYWLQFLNLRCATTNHNFFIPLQFFSVFKYIFKHIQVCVLVYIIRLIQTSALAT